MNSELNLSISLEQKMAIAAAETYSEVLQEVQEFINQFAVGIADRTLEFESSTAKQIESFNADIPSFASFMEQKIRPQCVSSVLPKR